jgi:putative acetyltransferase
MQLLETDRLFLRSWTEDDLDDFFAYASNPRVGPDAGWPPHTEKAVSLHILRKFIENDDVWAIVEKASGRVIGSLGLHRDTRRNNDLARMVGYVLRQESWGLGYTTEAVRRALRFAFEDMGLALVSVYHYPFNHRSRRVIEKCGFTHEGILRGASTLYDGKVLDDVCYSMTREEYRSRNP